MHGLVNRAVQCFLRDTYGAACWAGIAERAGVDPGGFEALLPYPDDMTHAVLGAAATMLGKPCEALLEDLGTYLASHPNAVSVRRLLRFGGASFTEFLFSLDELPGRARLAVPDLDLPTLTLCEVSETRFELTCGSATPRFSWVMVGILRAMADDYGALALLDHAEGTGGFDTVTIELHDIAFAKGRGFDLAMEVPR